MHSFCREWQNIPCLVSLMPLSSIPINLQISRIQKTKNSLSFCNYVCTRITMKKFPAWPSSFSLSEHHLRVQFLLVLNTEHVSVAAADAIVCEGRGSALSALNYYIVRPVQMLLFMLFHNFVGVDLWWGLCLKLTN